MVLLTEVNVLDFFVALELKFVDQFGGPKLADLSVDTFLYIDFFFLISTALLATSVRER